MSLVQHGGVRGQPSGRLPSSGDSARQWLIKAERVSRAHAHVHTHTHSQRAARQLIRPPLLGATQRAGGGGASGDSGGTGPVSSSPGLKAEQHRREPDTPGGWGGPGTWNQSEESVTKSGSWSLRSEVLSGSGLGQPRRFVPFRSHRLQSPGTLWFC